MIFLIVYSRTAGKLLKFSAFAEDEIVRAQRKRLKAELNASKDSDVEAVLLRAESESALRKSHSRYFESANSLLDALREGAAAS